MILKLSMSPVMVNCLTGSEMIEGKSGKAIFSNKWQKFDDAEECSWCAVSRFCNVKGGC